MVGLTSLIVLGLISAACLTTGAGVFGMKHRSPVKRAAKIERKIKEEKYLRDSTPTKKLIKMYKSQIVAMRFGRKPLMERVNHFNFRVNKDDDFDQIWDNSIADKSWRMIGIAKSKKKIAQLKLNKALAKNRGVNKAKSKLGSATKKTSELKNGPMKKYGWIESKKPSAGGGFANPIAGYYKINENELEEANGDYEVRYQMIAASLEVVGYDPGDIFSKAQKKYRHYHGDGAKFSRFGIDYPTASEQGPDRFVVGGDHNVAYDNKMFQTLKLVMIANACAKIVASKDKDSSIDKIRVIDESASKKNRCKIINSKEFADYIQKYLKSSSGKTALKALQKLDSKQAEKIQDTIQNFYKEIKFEDKKKKKVSARKKTDKKTGEKTDKEIVK